MIRVLFTILVFQFGKLDETVKTSVHEFFGLGELADALFVFTAMNNPRACDPDIRKIWMNSKKIQEPFIRQGLGPDTTLIIKEVNILG